MSAIFQARKGLESRLSTTPIVEGQVLFTTDKNNLFIDISNTERIQVNAKYAQGLINGSDTVSAKDVIDYGTRLKNIEQGKTGAFCKVTVTVLLLIILNLVLTLVIPPSIQN